MPLSRTSPLGDLSTDPAPASRYDGINRQKNVLSAISR